MRSGHLQLPFILVIVWTALATVTGCGGSDSGDTVAPPPGAPAPVVTSGQFDVTAHIIFDTCGLDSVYDGAYHLEIDGSAFTFGDTWSGTWNPTTASGFGESDHTGYSVRFCTVSRWTSLSLTFSTEDAFTGTIIYHQRVDGDCQDPCVTTWSLAGQRHSDPIE